LYFFDCTSCDIIRVKSANPMATSRKIKIGIYALSIVWSVDRTTTVVGNRVFIARGPVTVKKRKSKICKGFWVP
jgi:hypothetical protein